MRWIGITRVTFLILIMMPIVRAILGRMSKRLVVQAREAVMVAATVAE